MSDGVTAGRPGGAMDAELGEDEMAVLVALGPYFHVILDDAERALANRLVRRGLVERIRPRRGFPPLYRLRQAVPPSA